MKVSPSITFLGGCKEAVEFYKETFSFLKVKILTFNDKSYLFDSELTEKQKELIFRAELIFEDKETSSTVIMGDSPVIVFTGIESNPYNRDNITLELSITDRCLMESIYNKLLEGGKRNIPLEIDKRTQELTGSLIDKFGICWILRYSN